MCQPSQVALNLKVNNLIFFNSLDVGHQILLLDRSGCIYFIECLFYIIHIKQKRTYCSCYILQLHLSTDETVCGRAI